MRAWIMVKLFLHGVWRCLVKRASSQAPSTRVTIHEGSLTPVGPLAFGRRFGILERACHGDLALLVLGSQATSGVAAAYFSINFCFAPRGMRPVHYNHMVGVVRLVEVNG